MKNYNQKLIHIGRSSFKYSFILGTAILIAYFLTKSEDVAFFGLFYLVTAIAINLVTLIILIITLFEKEANLEKTFTTVGLMLVNIPIAFFYFWVYSYGLIFFNSLSI